MLEKILSGELDGPKLEMTIANAAGGFVVAGLAREMNHGIALAREQIKNGKALEKLRALQSFKATKSERPRSTASLPDSLRAIRTELLRSLFGSFAAYLFFPGNDVGVIQISQKRDSESRSILRRPVAISSEIALLPKWL